jgi:hypothetical protein
VNKQVSEILSARSRSRMLVSSGVRVCSVSLLGLWIGSPASAQQLPSRPGAPDAVSAAHERMAVFEGRWVAEPGAYFASGVRQPFREVEACAWLGGGRRHMVCRKLTEPSAGAPQRETISVMSYRASDSTYVIHFAFPGGSTLDYEGRSEGDRWVMNLLRSELLPPNQRLRTVITTAPTGLRFVEEQSIDGGPWTIGEDYRYRRAP